MIGNDLSGNPRRFVLFTVFYNARAYYPVMAVLFLDLGLTLDQFVLLNLVWAATIFLFEVPSGALADTVGRRPLLITAAVLMVLEMLCLLFASCHGGSLLFGLCILNRILSGLSEACASGADEALAYDSLDETGREEAWDGTLAKAMRWRSVGFVVAMILGGLIYDPSLLNRFFPEGFKLTAAITHRLPVVIVLVQGFICLGITWRMVEPPPRNPTEIGNSCSRAFHLTVQTARWVFTHPHTLVIVVFGLSIDMIVRNLATINSSYYTLIQLPAWTFGFIGATTGLLGWFVPTLAKKLNDRFSTLTNLGIGAAVTAVGLAAVAQVWPIYGLLPAMLLMTTLGVVSFTVSRALHRESDSSKRATVISVKGLAFNLGYGLFSLGFSRLLAGIPDQPTGMALRHALRSQVPVFVITAVVLYLWSKWLWNRSTPAL